MYDAYYKMETLEHYFGIILCARQLGGEHGVSPDQISELMQVRRDVFGKTDIGFPGDRYAYTAAGEARKSDEEAQMQKMIVITDSVVSVLKGRM